MAEMPKTVNVHLEFDEDTTQVLRQLVRDEIAMFAANVLTAAVDRRDGSGPWHRSQARKQSGENQ